MMKAFIVDDDIFYTSIVEQQLINCNIKAIYNFKKVSEALDELKKHKPEILLLDMFIENDNSIDFVSNIKNISPSTHIIMMSSSKEEQIRKNSIDKGAYAFIEKDERFYIYLKNILKEVKNNIEHLFRDK